MRKYFFGAIAVLTMFHSNSSADPKIDYYEEAAQHNAILKLNMVGNECDHVLHVELSPTGDILLADCPKPKADDDSHTCQDLFHGNINNLCNGEVKQDVTSVALQVGATIGLSVVTAGAGGPALIGGAVVSRIKTGGSVIYSLRGLFNTCPTTKALLNQVLYGHEGKEVSEGSTRTVIEKNGQCTANEIQRKFMFFKMFATFGSDHSVKAQIFPSQSSNSITDPYTVSGPWTNPWYIQFVKNGYFKNSPPAPSEECGQIALRYEALAKKLSTAKPEKRAKELERFRKGTDCFNPKKAPPADAEGASS